MNYDSIVPASPVEPIQAGGSATPKDVIDSIINNTVSALDVLKAGIGGQPRDDRTVKKAEDEISRQLLTLEVVTPLRQELLPRFQKWGYRLEPEVAVRPYGKAEHTYSALRDNSVELALAQLPPRVFATDSETGSELYLAEFLIMITAFREKRTRLFAEGIDVIKFAFRQVLEHESKGVDWQFISWSDVIDLQKGKLEFWQALALPGLARGGGKSAIQPKAISTAEENSIVDVLKRHAYDSETPDMTFRTLVAGTGWPEKWKNARLTGWTNNAEVDARNLVTYMKGKDTFPATHALAGQSVIGDFLRMMLELEVLGGKDSETLARILVDCALVPDANKYTKYYQK